MDRLRSDVPAARRLRSRLDGFVVRIRGGGKEILMPEAGKLRCADTGTVAAPARDQADSRDHALSLGASGRGSVSKGRTRLGFGIRQVLFKHVDVPDIVPSDLGGRW